jgi:hypothetical protein
MLKLFEYLKSLACCCSAEEQIIKKSSDVTISSIGSSIPVENRISEFHINTIKGSLDTNGIIPTDHVRRIIKFCNDEFHFEAKRQLDKLLSEHPTFIFEQEYAEVIDRLNWKCKRVKEVLKLFKESEIIIPKEIKDSDFYNLESGGWIHEKAGRNQLWLKYKADGSMMFKMSGVLDSSLFHMMSLIYEVDLHSQFLLFLKQSESFHDVKGCGDRAQKIGRHTYSLPLPGVCDREMTWYAFGSDLLLEPGVNAVVICMSSLDQLSASDKRPVTSWWGYPVPEPTPRTVQIEAPLFGFILKPISNGKKTWQTMIANIDMKLPGIPKCEVVFLHLHWTSF